MDNRSETVRRVLKVLAWIGGGIVVLLVAVGAAAYLFVTSDFVRGQIENRADAYSGRKTKIGNVTFNWGWTSHVHLDDVQISNADWAKAPHLLTAQAIDFDIRVWPLLHGDVQVQQLQLVKPVVDLERNAKEESNWSAAESPVAHTVVNQVKPDNRGQTPLIGRLVITDGRVTYADTKRKLDLDGTISTAMGQAGAEPQAELMLKGRLEGEALSLHFIGGSALMLRQTDIPYPIDLDVVYGGARLQLKGTVQDPFQFNGANVQLSLAGPDLSQIYPLLGIPGPPTPPYRIVGKLDREPGVWKLTNMSWHAGDSDLAGAIAIDDRQKPGLLTARLVSDRLAFADLAPLIGATPGKRGNVSPQQRATEERLEARGELFPNVPLHVERLRAMNMDVTLDARRVTAPSYLPVQAIAAHVLVRDGQATVQPLRMAFGGGEITGTMGVDARPELKAPLVRADLGVEGVDLGAFFRGSRFFDTTRGKLSGRIRLLGSGNSLARVMGTADGDIGIAMAGGNVSELMVAAANLQIIDALLLYVTGDHQIPIRCALARLVFNNGIVAFQKTLMDTVRSVLHVDGTTVLKTQEVNIKVTADPKQFSLLDLHSPVLVRGKIRSPSISLDRAIPIPTPDFGGASDVDCQALTHELTARR
jgi:AsmA family protein